MSQPRTDNTGRIVKSEKADAPKTLAAFIGQPSFLEEIKRALPTHLTPERMLRVAITSLRTTPNLANCDQNSFCGCLLQASQLGLEVNTPLGHAYLIPRKDRDSGRYYCTMILGYQGMIELALRSGKVSGIKTIIVRVGDHFIYEDGLVPVLKYVPSADADREKREITHAVGIAYIKGGDPIFEVLSRAQIDARRERSDSARSGKSSPWKTDYEAMARKTVVRSLFKWVPKSPEIAAAGHLEESAERGSRQGFATEVIEAMERQGLQAAPIDAIGEALEPGSNDEPDIDPETGEVVNAQPAQTAAAAS